MATKNKKKNMNPTAETTAQAPAEANVETPAAAPAEAATATPPAAKPAKEPKAPKAPKPPKEPTEYDKTKAVVAALPGIVVKPDANSNCTGYNGVSAKGIAVELDVHARKKDILVWSKDASLPNKETTNESKETDVTTTTEVGTPADVFYSKTVDTVKKTLKVKMPMIQDGYYLSLVKPEALGAFLASF